MCIPPTSAFSQIYRSLKPTWGGTGYLTREGAIDDPERLEQFLREVGSKEDEIFSERAVEEAEFRGRRRRTSHVLVVTCFRQGGVAYLDAN